MKGGSHFCYDLKETKSEKVVSCLCVQDLTTQQRIMC